MNRFVKVKPLIGELKRSEVRRGTSYKLTTREFVLQREDRAYQILFDDVLGVLPRDESERYDTTRRSGDTIVSTDSRFPSYKIIVTRMRVYRDSGRIDEQGPATLHTELSNELFSQFLSYLTARHGPSPLHL